MADDRQLYIKLILQDQTKQGFDSVNKQVKGTQKSLFNLKNVILAVAGSVVIRQTLELANTYQNLQNRLKLVTGSAEELATVQQGLFEISQRTRGGFAETVELYQKLALQSKNLGLESSELSQITENVNKVIAIAGVNSIQASSGILQLSQAFASGRLQGDEFRSISENIPPLLDIFAKELGVTRGELKKLGAEGKITSDIIATALLKETENINEQFGQLSPTLSQASTTISNSFLNLAGQLAETTGIADLLAGALIGVSKAIDSITESLKVTEPTIRSTTERMRELKEEVEGTRDELQSLGSLELRGAGTGLDILIDDLATDIIADKNREIERLNNLLIDLERRRFERDSVLGVLTSDDATYKSKVNIDKIIADAEIQIEENKNKELLRQQEEFAKELKRRRSAELIFARMEAEKKAELERQAQSQIVDAVGDGLSKVAGLNRGAFQAYQAFQTAMATINTFRAVSNALSTYPFPLNIGVAGAELARGLATVAQIRSTSYSGRALGGRVQAGSTYMVGEQGAEMFVPDQSGTIIPNKDLGKATNVNITINANDTQGFDDLLIKRRSVIVNVINDALNSQGKEALV